MSIRRLLERTGITGQAVRFVAVGLINTVVDLGVFYLLGIVPGVPMVAAKFISYNVGTTNSFLLNKYWTFGAGRSKRGLREFGVFFAINVPPLVLDVVAFAMLGLWTGSGSFVARMAKALIAAVLTAAWTFIGSRYLAFRQTAIHGRGHA